MMVEGQFLSEKEIDEFLNDLDKNDNGHIEYDEIEHKLDQVHKEIAPEAKSYNLHHADQTSQRHRFLRNVLGTDKNQISRADFAKTVKGWNVPSTNPGKKAQDDHKAYMKKLPLGRRLRAFWSVEGPEVMFIALVVSMQIAFGTWQLVKYASGMQYRHAFGWGVVLAKTSAGILYPTLFFLVLSMSRWISTFARKFYHISRFINWDLSQSFHIKISICALAFASLHAIGHLTGTFLYGSRPAQQSSVAAVLGPDAVPKPYVNYVRTRPGWTGLVAFGLFWTLAGMSAPFIRKKSYEAFQLGHLLMFPIIGLLIAHGTLGLLQFPMLGYWLAVPTLLVLWERIARVIAGLHRIPATLKILDADTVSIKVTIPERRYFPYKAGQYIFLQVPKLSFFQWHPFTISACIGNEMHLHIKTDGNWTSKLRDLAKEGEPQSVEIGIDGPFGAPAQRFYDFDQTIILGSGIGVTPFSGILTDLAKRNKRQRRARNLSTPVRAEDMSEKSRDTPSPRYRRVDFHWIVKDRNYLLWFSDLLNRVSRSCAVLAHDENPRLEVHIRTHVTQKRKNLSTYIFRYLLEIHRTAEHPESPITGLLNSTNFGRPDLAKIMDDHYEVMLKLFKKAKDEGQNVEDWKVGVFFCGAPPIGFELADRCQLLTLRGREDGNNIEYHFMMEVFG